MKRIINSTGRKQIPLENIAIRLHSVNNNLNFTAAVTVPEHWSLPPSAKVYVEAYVRSTSQRFSFGSVSEPRRPVSTALTELETGKAILFRVKIVDDSLSVGRILASTTGIRPHSESDGDEDGRTPLLPVQERNLGELLWELELPSDSGPILVMNNRLPDIANRLKTDPLLRAALLPEVLRQTVLHVYTVGNEGDEWAEDWKTFIRSLLGRSINEDFFSEAPTLTLDGETELAEIIKKFSIQNNFASAILTSGEQHVD